MQALHGEGLPPAWRAYGAMLLRRRRGLRGGDALPRIERSATGLQLDPAWLAAYRAIVGLAPEAAEGRSAVPPLALQIAAAPLHLSILADAAFPFRAFGLVHVAQRVEQIAPLRPQERFALSAFTGPVRPARRGVEFDLITEVQADGRCAWRGITTAVSLGAAGVPTAVSAAATAPAEGAPWQTIAHLAAPEPLGRRYAAIAGDLNPIHQHALLARPFGFDRAIVHGTWTLARALAAAGWPRTPAFVLEARFRRPVLLPSDLLVAVRSAADAEELRVTSPDGATLHLTAAMLAAPVPSDSGFPTTRAR